MDNVTIVGIVTLLGALAGTFVPYVLKVWKCPDTKFDINYGYALALGALIQVIALIPDDVPTLTLNVVLTAFAAGFGVQAILNKAVPK